MRITLLASLSLAVLATPALAAKDGPKSRADIPTQTEKKFGKLDANKDGFVTADELSASITAKKGAAPPEKRVQKMLAKIDGNGDGKVSLKEMTDAALQKFDGLDTNKNGVLDPSEQPDNGGGNE